MKRNQGAISIPAFAILAIFCVSTFPATGAAGEDSEADREYRRVETELRRQQEMARRDIESRERAQAEALRGQEDAIRRMETTRARIEANAPQAVQPYVDPTRVYIYPYNSANAPLPAAPVDRARLDDAVSGMSFAPLTEQLGSYFGTQTGVLVVRAGAGAPFGLQDGDVILAVDGRVPTDGQHLAGILRSYRPGERVKLQVQRQRKAINLDTTAPALRSN
jgi:C-terminal processing protease CtpA/Prc